MNAKTALPLKKRRPSVDVVAEPAPPYGAVDARDQMELWPESKVSEKLARKRLPHQQKSGCAIASFFSGVGFLDLGFEYGGFNIQHVNEVHEPFLNAYKYSRDRIGLKPPEFDHYCGSISEYFEGARRQIIN